MDITSIQNAVGLGNTAESPQQGIAGDFNTFLTLLTTQLQNQDPLEPTDTNEFTRQLVSFAGVEQQIRSNDKLEQLAALNVFGQRTGAVGFLGRTATIAGDTARHDGSGLGFEYTLPRAADGVELTIRDAFGNEVFSGRGETTAGRHEIFWPGLDENGAPVDPGTFTLSVNATNADGGRIPADVFVSAPVEKVETSGQVPTLTVGGREVTLDEILAVR